MQVLAGWFPLPPSRARRLTHGVGAAVVGDAVGDALGDVLGEGVVGDALGEGVSPVNVGDADGDAVVGAPLGDALGDVGEALGDAVHCSLVHTGYGL